MPTYRHGKGTKVLVGAFDLTAMLREANISRTVDTAETTAFGSSVKTYVPGVVGATVSLNGMFSGAAGEVDAVFNTIFGQAASVPVTVAYDGAGAGSGIPALSRTNIGETLEASYGVSGSVSDMVAVSAEFQPTGGFIGAWSLQDLTSQTPATANGSTVDMLYGGEVFPLTVRFFSVMHVISNTLANTGNVAVVIETSAASNMSGAATVLTHTPITTAAGTFAEVQRQNSAVTLNRYVRVRYTYTPTLTGNFTAHLSFGRFAF